MGRTFNPERAEREADKIGMHFVHSNDVVKDMSRAYHVDFSNIRVHTDSAADNKVKAAGKDALAQGNDIFFGKGIFESDHPAAKGLVAHEFAHTMQQGAALGGEMAVAESAPMGVAQGGKIWDWFKNLFKRKPNPEDQISFAKHAEQKPGKDLRTWWDKSNRPGASRAYRDESRAGIVDYVKERISGDRDKQQMLDNGILSNASRSTNFDGLSYIRLLSILRGELGEGLSKEDIGDLFDKLLAGGKVSELNRSKDSTKGITEEEKQYMSGVSEDEIAELDGQFDEGIMQLKGIYLAQLRRLKERYGTYMTQMHPQDFLSRVGPELFDQTRILQDCQQMMQYGGKYFDYENNEDDREFKTLANYYNNAFVSLDGYMQADKSKRGEAFIAAQDRVDFFEERTPYLARAYEQEAAVGGPGFTEKEQKDYVKRVQRRQRRGHIQGIWGRFRKK